MTKRVKATVMGLVAVVAAASVAVVVLAQTDTKTATSGREGLLAKVAANLGVAVDDLVAAFTKARVELIDEAVAAGRITAEQAEEMKARMEARQALRGVFADALAEGKITQDQLALVRTRTGGLMGREGAVPRGRAVLGRMMGRMMDRKCP